MASAMLETRPVTYGSERAPFAAGRERAATERYRSPPRDQHRMPDSSQVFKIDRSQRIHSDGVVVRVYQVFGTDQYGWDTNREVPPPNRPLYHSREQAEQAADLASREAGHACHEACYGWRTLGDR
jgi:hypothetical protein